MSAFCAAVDWGTTSFRLWLLDGGGATLAESRGPEGMMHCRPAGFAPALAGHLARAGAPRGCPVVICGMAGARDGWLEARYLTVPARLDALPAAAVRVPGEGADVRILPGLASREPEAPDVMRGEETQLLGLAAAGRSLVCAPGTHSKWSVLEDGAVTGFTTFMTGELFALLAARSVLAAAVDAQAGIDPAGAAFAAGLDAALADPGALASRLFAVRARHLLEAAAPADGAARLSGLLIGAEVAAARRLAADGAVRLVASGQLARLYRAALERAGLAVDAADAEAATRGGLFAAARQIWKEPRA